MKKNKLTRLMMICTLYIICTLSMLASSAKVMTMKLENVTLKEVFEAIESRSDYLILVSSSDINLNERVSIDVVNKSVKEILDEVAVNKKFTYEIKENHIIIYKSDKKAGTNAVQQQRRQITGRVVDENGEVVIGANVVEKGTTNGAITDVNGNFSLQIAEGAVLQVTYVGYLPVETTVGNRNSIVITIREDIQALEEVVVVGYGVQKVETVTGSVSAIKGEKLTISPTVNYSQALAGRLPGLVAVSRTGEPGSDNATLRIRGVNTLGDNSPLIVIDGIPGRDMNRLNADDIESMSVLKDASAAIYGSRAANGVILITTKRGNIGKAKVTISYNEGLSQPTIIPKMGDAVTYLTMLNEISMYAGSTPKYSAEEIENYRKGGDPWRYPNTDWFGETFKTFASQRKVNGSIQGGSDRFNYFVSVGGNYQDAIYKNSATYYQQANFRGNIDGKINDYIKIRFDISGRQQSQHYPTVSSGSIFGMLMRGKPNMQAYWPNGKNGPDIEYGQNPVVVTTNQTGYDNQTNYILETKAGVDIDIPGIKGLSVSANYSYDINFYQRKLWETPWYLWSWDGVTVDSNNVPVLNEGKKGLANPQLFQRQDTEGRTTINALINYAKTFAGDHNTKIMVGAERISGNFMRMDATRKYYVSTALDELFAGSDLEKDNTGYSSENKRMNFFGRINYDYKTKYLLEFLWRVDGSYIFPSNKRFGFFPGISAGWRISEESFWKNSLSFINYMKFRASWGQTGNDRIDTYQFLSSFAFRTGAAETYVFNMSTQNKILQESRIPNPDITWEVGNQSNFGLDGQMMDGKLSFSFEYFYNLRTNILWNRNASVPGSTGLTLPRENIGKYNNQGIEFQVGYADKTNDFSYGISFNGGTSKSKIIFWDETPGVPDYQKTTGYPAPIDLNNTINVGNALYYKAIGIFRDQAHVDSYPHWGGARPGDVIFEDVNNDGAINGLDRIRINKNVIPTFTGGLNIDLQYQNVYASLFFQASAGAIRYRYYEMQGESGNFLKVDQEGRWTPDNPNAQKPRTWNRYGEYWRNNRNTYWLEDNDYIRLKNMEIGYNFPRQMLKVVGITALRAYVSGQNLLTFTKIKDFDPESESATSYPTSRVINLGVNLTF